MDKSKLTRLKDLEAKLAKYKPIYLEKKRVFRGVSHENALAELRYTQFMVYKDLVEGVEKEIRAVKASEKSGGGGMKVGPGSR